MTLDLILLALVLIFAALGAVTGAARQVASLAATFVAYLVSKPIAQAYGPRVAASMHIPELFGVLATTLVAFIVVLLVVRSALTSILRRILQGKERERANFDGVLGFFFGGAKVALVGYVMLSALAFVQENLMFAGKPLGISPQDSQAFAFAKKHNLMAMGQFSGVKDLVRITQALQDPVQREQLRQDPAFQSLLKDARFRTALKTPGDGSQDANNYATLLRNNAVFQLVQDRLAAKQMESATDAIENIPEATPEDNVVKPAPTSGHRRSP